MVNFGLSNAAATSKKELRSDRQISMIGAPHDREPCEIAKEQRPTDAE